MNVNRIVRTVITTRTKLAFLSTPCPRRHTAASSPTECRPQLSWTKMTNGTLAVVVIDHACQITPMTRRAWEAAVQVYSSGDVAISMHGAVNWLLSPEAVLASRACHTKRCSINADLPSITGRAITNMPIAASVVLHCVIRAWDGQKSSIRTVISFLTRSRLYRMPITKQAEFSCSAI